MANNPRIQVTATPKLVNDITLYMEERGVNQSQAGKELMELGIRVWQQNQQEGEGELSTMDVLKKILTSSYTVHAFLNTTANKNIAKVNDESGEPYMAAPLMKNASLLAIGEVEKIFNPESPNLE